MTREELKQNYDKVNSIFSEEEKVKTTGKFITGYLNKFIAFPFQLIRYKIIYSHGKQKLINKVKNVLKLSTLLCLICSIVISLLREDFSCIVGFVIAFIICQMGVKR